MVKPLGWQVAVGALSLVCCAVSGLRAEVVVPVGSSWKWLHASDGKDPAGEDEDFHTTFYAVDFDDAAWKTGTDQAGPHGGFGYGDPEFAGVDIGQPADPERRKTAYLRLTFQTDEPHEKWVFKCQRDDAIVVYLDGQEVLRDNLPADAKEAYDLFASEVVSGAAETKVNSFPFTLTLPAGKHVLAVSLHNRSGGSSDLRIGEISLETTAAGDEGE